MPFICRGKCDHELRHNPKNILRRMTQYRYKSGWTWCSICHAGKKTDDLNCFCCGARTRAGTHYKSNIEYTGQPIELRICAICKSNETYVSPEGYITWFRHGNNNEFACDSCYHRMKHKKKRDEQRLKMVMNVK
jgi:hypothetical protein